MRQLATTLCCVLIAAPAAATTERATPSTTAAAKLICEKHERGVFKAEVGNNLRLGNFDWLEATAAKLIKEDPRYACGVSKLVDFYATFDPERAEGPEGADARVAEFTAWAKAKPDSHWPKVGFSVVEAWRARQARGTRWASETTRAQFEEHDRHMQLAMEWAMKALADEPGDPELYTHLIGVCRGVQCPPEQAVKWLAAALAINPGYDAVVITMANTLLPRWLGNADAFVDFAEWVADENPALGNIGYVRIATVALMIDGDKLRETYPRMSWDRIQDGLRQIDKKHPDSSRTFHLLARFAYVFEDRVVAKEALARLKDGWRADVDYWRTPDAFHKAYIWAMGEEPGPF
jgi:tetratricopeptide (TPR) repeat protein